MDNQFGRDVARQAANVVGAIFHIVAGMILAQGEMPGEDITLIQPWNYAFIIWGPIFLLCLAYAAFQALPASRARPLLRRTGWYTAGAFLLNGLLVILASPERFVVTEGLVIVMLLCLAVAYVRLMRSERGALSGADRWLVALPLGPFFGWITAANAVSLTAEAVRSGLVAPGGAGEALVGTVLLLVGALLTCAVILAGRTGPVQVYLTYGATVLWALTGIVVNQYAYSLVTTGASLLAAILVAVVLFVTLRRERPGGSARRIARPGKA